MADTADKNTVLNAFQRLKGRLRQMAARITGDEICADDVLQDAFVKLWVRRSDIGSDNEACALMTTTVRNLSIDEIRRQKHLACTSVDEQCEEPPDDAYELQRAAEERLRKIELIIAQRLTPVQRRILLMRDCDGLDYDYIAQELQMQAAAVRMQLSRARKVVRDIYREQENGLS